MIEVIESSPERTVTVEKIPAWHGKWTGDGPAPPRGVDIKIIRVYEPDPKAMEEAIMLILNLPKK